jgi:hypothetical protein
MAHSILVAKHKDQGVMRGCEFDNERIVELAPDLDRKVSSET